MGFMEHVVLGNRMADWMLALAVGCLTLVLLKILKGGTVRRLSELAGKTETVLDDILADLVVRTTPLFMAAVAIFMGSMSLTLSPGMERLIKAVLVLCVLYQAGVWAGRGVQLWVMEYTKRNETLDSSSITTLTFVGYISKLAIWTVVFLLALENLGVDITALVAGLGIGGIAVALAAQSVLGDLFASLSIVLDKPFVIDDFIIVGDYMGTVEHIGIKTTRVRSLSGEQLVFSNADLLASRIRNYKRMSERRVVYTIGVVYGTPAEKLERIPGMIKGITEEIDGARFDRAHFARYGAYSLDFEAVYFVASADYMQYMDIQQNINLTLYRTFEAEGIEFAYPTQTLFVNQQAAAA